MKLFVALLMMIAFLAPNAAEAKRRRRHHRGGQKEEVINEKSLYERLGGKEALGKVIDDFVTNCTSDDRVKSFFAGVTADKKDFKKFKANLTEQICEISGGPCKYNGRSMKDAHKGLAIDDQQFTAVAEDLVRALEKYHVGEREKNELLAGLGPLRAEIVVNSPVQ